MLTSEQAKKNQEKYGFNELTEGKKKSVLRIFLEQFKDFLVIILIVSAVISGILGDAESAIVIFVVITMNAVLGTIQTVKAEQSLDSLKQLSAPEAKVVRDDSVIQIPSREVTIGDEVILEAGDCIPADGKLIECASLKVDESALTGESISIEKNLDEVEEAAALGDQTNRVFSGSFVTYGRGRYEVTAIGMKTEVGKIADLMKNTSEKRTPLQVNLDDFGKKLSVLILAFSVVIFGVNVFQGESWGSAFMFAVALAVAAIPEALSSIVTIVLSFGTQKMAKEHAIIRKLQAVEGLGSVSIVCSDKTGTLTQNKMTVEDYYVNGKRIPAGKINLKNENEKLLLRFSILCNDSTNTDGQEIGDPTETALINLGTNLGIDAMQVRERYPRLSEVPFDSDRKLMSTAHNMNDALLQEGHMMIVKGAVDVLLERMDRIRVGNTVRRMTDSDREDIAVQNMQFSREGLRVLAFAYKQMEEEKMADKIRVLLGEEEVNKRINEVAEQINKDYAGKDIHLICILKGGVFFMCELAKRITVPVSMDFMCVGSYGDGTASSGVVRIAKDLDESIENKEVLIVEDIIDSGNTLYYLIDVLKKRNPASMRLCTLLDKPDRRVKDVKVDYCGFEIPDEFVVGYGLDYAQKYRNLPYIGVVEGVE